MTPAARVLPDTDWHVDRLYDFLDAFDATVLVATHSRYVIDLNRPPDGGALYPGQAESGLCPTLTFAGEHIYDGAAPDAPERERRRVAYWQPYHDRLRAELDRLRAAHARVVLWDAHSIRSEVPALFGGELPVLNLGTHSGRACDNELAAALFAVAQNVSHYPAVLNGRFTGGHITRAYGDPERGVHAVQLELAQRSYMCELPPFDFDRQRAGDLRPVLQALLTTAVEFAGSAR